MQTAIPVTQTTDGFKLFAIPITVEMLQGHRRVAAYNPDTKDIKIIGADGKHMVFSVQDILTDSRDKFMSSVARLLK